MAEAPALQGSTALWVRPPARPEVRLVPAFPTTALPSEAATAGRSASAGRSTSGEAFRTSTQRSAKRPLILTRRGRLLLVGLPISLAVAALILLGAFLTSQAHAGESAPTSSSTIDVNVTPGETLWDLAVQYAPERDPRDVVAEMVELNDLHGSVVQAGQSISVPAQG